MKIKICADSSANIFSMNDADFSYASMRVCAGEKEYLDTPALDIPLMIRELSEYKGKSGSACPGVEEWLAAFGDADTVYAVSITSNLSGCYNAAFAAIMQKREAF